MQQTLFKPQPNTTPSQKKRSQTIIFTALALFALSGLMIGFVVGIFTHIQSGNASKANHNTSSGVVIHQQNPTQTVTIQPMQMGCPTPTFNGTEQADGTTPYTFVAQAQNNSTTCSTKLNTPIHAPGISFKLWLIQRLPDNGGIAFTDGAQQIYTTLNQPTVGKMTRNGKLQNDTIAPIGGINFDATTPQVQTSNAQGQVTWKYTLAPTLQNGTYDLVVLADWSGKFYNWSWWQITVNKAGNN